MMMKIKIDDIPPGNISIRLKKKFVENLLRIIKKSGTILPDKIKLQLYRMQKGHKVNLSFIMQFALDMDISIEEIQNNIELITSIKSTNIGIKNPKFPINFQTKEGARFVAAIMGDGELNKQLNVRYNNQNKKLIDLILRSAKKIFGEVNYKLYYREDKTYQLHFPKIIGLIVQLLGIKSGYKSKTNYGIPLFIQNSSLETQSVFIRQFFNDEGNVRLKDRRLQVKQTVKVYVDKKTAKADPQTYAHKSLVDLQKLLLNQGIDSKISLGCFRGDKIDWELSIYRKENLTIFKNFIGFDILEKTEKLTDSINSYKFPSVARNKRIEYALEKAKEVEEKYGFITKDLLAKECKKSLKTVTYYLVDLKKKNMIKCVEKPRKKYGHPLPHKYKIISL